MTRVIEVDPERPQPSALEEAARVLREGGLVAIPTETVYGLAGRALDDRSIARIYEAKGRPSSHPLIAHVTGEEDARRLAASWPALASSLARAFWPGPLTLVVERAANVPAAITGGASSIAVRAPAHAVALGVIAALGEPIAAPSANRYQEVSPTTAAHVLKSLRGRLDLVLDAGPCREGIESTVVDVRGAPRVVRPGAIDLASLRRFADVSLETGGERVSPGMDPRHYAPRAKVIVTPDPQPGPADGVLAFTSFAMAKVSRVMPRDPRAYARELFAALHAMDDAGVERILVELVPEDEAWLAVADRLRRAGSK